MASDDLLLVPCRQTTTGEQGEHGKEETERDSRGEGRRGRPGCAGRRRRRPVEGEAAGLTLAGEGQVDRWGGWDREDREKLWLVGALRDPRRSTGWLDQAGGGFEGDLECGGG